jgi:hypothetical protein
MLLKATTKTRVNTFGSYVLVGVTPRESMNHLEEDGQPTLVAVVARV